MREIGDGMDASFTDVVRHITLKGDAIPANTLEVLRVTGKEAISELFRFEIDLVSDNPDVDLEPLLFTSVVVDVAFAREERRIAGMVIEVASLDEVVTGQFHYRVVIGPRLSALRYVRHTHLYQELSVIDILRCEIESSYRTDLKEISNVRISDLDFEVRTFGADYAALEYVVQYQESDLNFLSRLLEKYGLFYFFDAPEGRDRLVVTDDNMGFPHDGPVPILHFRRANQSLANGSVFAFGEIKSPTASRVVLNDYNYREPHRQLLIADEANADGVGLDYTFGEHFKTEAEGRRMARLRAEAIAVEKATFAGQSIEPGIRVGAVMEIDGHFRARLNRRYRVRSIEHVIHGPKAAACGLFEALNGEDLAYRNRFTCIPQDVPFRAPMETDRPRISGVINAHVDGTVGEMPDIDEEGRYRVRLPFDVSGAPDGKASRYIRLATPFGGRDEGMHFPLRRGTEVLLSHVLGDPDRPIIVGTVPNPDTPSLVNKGNANTSRIRNQSGAAIVMGHAPATPAEIPTPTVNLASVMTDGDPASEGPSGDGFAAMKTLADTQVETDGDVTSNTFIVLETPEYEDGKSSYLRIGSPPVDSELTVRETDYLDGTDYSASEVGWVDYTDGARVSVTKGNNHNVTKNGDGFPIASSYVGMSAFGPINFDYTAAKSTTATLGLDTTLSASSSTAFAIGSKCEVGATYQLAANLAETVELNYGLQWTYSKAGSVEMNLGTHFAYVDHGINQVSNSIVMGVHDVRPYTATANENFSKGVKLPLQASIAGFLVGAAGGGIASGVGSTDKAGLMAVSDAAALGGLGAATFSALTAAVQFQNLKAQSALVTPDPYLMMDRNNAVLSKGHNAGVIPFAGGTLVPPTKQQTTYVNLEDGKLTLRAGNSYIEMTDGGLTIVVKGKEVFTVNDRHETEIIGEFVGFKVPNTQNVFSMSKHGAGMVCMDGRKGIKLTTSNSANIQLKGKYITANRTKIAQ